MNTIYKLQINDTPIYIGKTKDINLRYISHRECCYNQKQKPYDTFLYNTIRNLGIRRDQFYKYVKMEPIYNNVPTDIVLKLETLTMNLYSDFGYKIYNTNKHGADYNDPDYIRTYNKRCCYYLLEHLDGKYERFAYSYTCIMCCKTILLRNRNRHEKSNEHKLLSLKYNDNQYQYEKGTE